MTEHTATCTSVASSLVVSVQATNQSIDYNNEAKLGALHPTVTIAISIMIAGHALMLRRDSTVPTTGSRMWARRGEQRSNEPVLYLAVEVQRSVSLTT